MHYTVAERTQEIGVRVALGATRADVVGRVISQGMRLPLAGIALGLGLAASLTRVISHLPFNVGAMDPMTFNAVGIMLVLVAAVACYLPARRAAGIDPVRALKGG